MESAAILGALVKIALALPKVLKVIDENRKQLESLEGNVISIAGDLDAIQETIRSSSGGVISDCRIRDLRRLADDIEDCIGRFQVRKISRIRFAKKIGELMVRTEKKLQKFQTKSGGAPSSTEDVPPCPDGPVGMKHAEDKLLALVQSQSEGRLKVISVVGFGGLGKTLLAHQIYNHSDVRDQFPLRALVDAAGLKSTEDVLKEILEQVSPSEEQAEHSASSTPSIDQLTKLLKTTRYLIVIDDVGPDDLGSILCAFSWADGVGGRIIATTTIRSAVTCCSCGSGGLPPALDITAQVFIRELAEKGFQDACPKLCVDTLERMQLSSRKILSSHNLEDCLLYFCMFPCNHHIRRNPLIRRWLAEGLVHVQQNENSYPQDVAVKKLDILMKNNIIKPFQVSSNGKAKRCQPPMMMLDSLSSESMSQDFITMLCGRTYKLGNVRRLSVHPNSAPAANLSKKKRAAADGRLKLHKHLSRLHTLAVFSAANYEPQLNFAKYELLRVLDLKDCAGLGEDDLKAICDLLLLKYLSLGDSIAKVPRRIGNLKLLETLDMRRTDIVQVPIEVVELPELKHLLGKFQIFEGDLTKEKLEEFESEDYDSKLERLSGFVTGGTEGFPQLMSHMKGLRKVKIWCDSTANETNLTQLSEAIKKFRDINKSESGVDVSRSLSIVFQGCSTECSEPFMESLQTDGRLTSLKLRGKLTRFPQFHDRLNTIEELCLSWTNLSWDTIRGGLSVLKFKLKYLKLVEDKLGPVYITSENFVSLNRLCLVGVNSMGGIKIQANALPHLESLHILCETLDVLPGSDGIQIRCLGRLEQVALHSGVAQEIKDGWQAAAMDHPNRPNVLFIGSPKSSDRDLLGTNGTNANQTSFAKLLSSMKHKFFCGYHSP